MVTGCGGSSSSSSSSSTASTTSAPATTATTSSTPAATSSTPAASGSSSSKAQLIKLAADPGGQLKYDTTSLTAKAGKVTIEFTNASPVPHDVSVSGNGVSGATPQFSGGSKSLSLNLKAGTYKFFCSVPGHEQAGMQGTLTVN
ncbi:MAG TPA: plastocyanin/azurin family copper-binding protein [Solirubrobacteraceae bacterium]|nr:plastocyanin/azurin family copper-binding protein [Solirubrobacteraceae bacterium]